MTDRELLELAAKAAGYKIAWEGGCETGWMAGGTWWNPLSDDGDAFRLALRLPLDICRTNAEYAAVCVWVDHRGYFIEEPHNGDPCAATRRAIVRAAAEIGKAMS